MSDAGLYPVWHEFINGEPEGRVLQTFLFHSFVNDFGCQYKELIWMTEDWYERNGLKLDMIKLFSWRLAVGISAVGLVSETTIQKKISVFSTDWVWGSHEKVI